MIRLPARSVLFILTAAFLFGTATPLAKMVLTATSPITLASMIYAGSGVGMALFRVIRHACGYVPAEAPLTRQAVPWIMGASFFGAVLATTCLTLSIRLIPAWQASVLLSFEAVATALVAGIIFAEYTGPRVWAALACITAACITLAWQPDQPFGLSLGAMGIIFTCFCWGVDTSCSRQIAGRDPYAIVMYKGLFAAVVTFTIGRFLGEPFPDPAAGTAAILLGLTGFGGLMTLCFLKALRDLGPARTGSYFGINPLFGIAIGLLLFRDTPGLVFLPAVGLMLAGIVILMTEEHAHAHRHLPLVHDHRHRHDDKHHDHPHPAGISEPEPGRYHTHLHSHRELEHDHPHTPDLHHQHPHR